MKVYIKMTCCYFGRVVKGCKQLVPGFLSDDKLENRWGGGGGQEWIQRNQLGGF
jgi:hypothetical protein